MYDHGMIGKRTAYDRPELSIVIPCYNEEDNVRGIYAAVTAEAEAHARSHEIVFIDNMSTDTTRTLLREICAKDPRVRAIFNNKNYGQMRSPTYAIYQCEGEAVIGMCADFQDPPALIGSLMAQWRAGAQIVMAQRQSEKASPGIRLGRKIGYMFFSRFADYAVIPGATGFGLFDRVVVDALAAWNEPEPFFRGMVIESGYRLAVIPFVRPERAAGTSKNNFFTLLDFAISGLAGSSKALLRAPIMLSVYVAILAGFVCAATLACWIWGGPVGFMALLSAQLVTFTVTLLFTGLIGEQVRVISERTRNVPLVLEEERINFPEGRERPAARTVVQAAL